MGVALVGKFAVVGKEKEGSLKGLGGAMVLALGEEANADPYARYPNEGIGSTGGLVFYGQVPLQDPKNGDEEYRWDAASALIQSTASDVLFPNAVLGEDSFPTNDRHRIDLSRAALSVNELKFQL